MFSEIPREQHVVSPENSSISPKLIDFSGLEPWFVKQQTEHLIAVAKKIITFPDLGPTESTLIPTGCIAQFNVEETPDYLKFVKGADIGCAMLMAKQEGLFIDQFRTLQPQIDKLYAKIKSQTEFTLGGGNHFIDFVTDSDGQVYVVIHTGAYRDKQHELTAIIKEEMQKQNPTWTIATAQYMELYQKVIESGKSNRYGLLNLISQVFGNNEEILFNEPHNTIKISDNAATVYKGVVHVSDTNKRLLLPSTMDTPMAWYLPGTAIGQESLFGAPHGTGRNLSRKEIKQIPITSRLNIMTVTGKQPPRTELPDAYRPIMGIDGAETKMLNNNLMKYDNENDIKYLQVLAYLGHI